MSKKNDTVESATTENGGAQVESVNGGSSAVKDEKPYQIVNANSHEELDKAISDLKAQQPEGVSLISGPIAQDAFGKYETRIDYVKKV